MKFDGEEEKCWQIWNFGYWFLCLTCFHISFISLMWTIPFVIFHCQRWLSLTCDTFLLNSCELKWKLPHRMHSVEKYQVAYYRIFSLKLISNSQLGDLQGRYVDYSVPNLIEKLHWKMRGKVLFKSMICLLEQFEK